MQTQSKHLPKTAQDQVGSYRMGDAVSAGKLGNIQSVLDAYNPHKTDHGRMPWLAFSADEASEILRGTVDRLKGEQAITGQWRAPNGSHCKTLDQVVAAWQRQADAATDHRERAKSLLMLAAYTVIRGEMRPGAYQVEGPFTRTLAPVEGLNNARLIWQVGNDDECIAECATLADAERVCDALNCHTHIQSAA